MTDTHSQTVTSLDFAGSGSSTFTYQRTRPGRQPLGFCEKHNLEHLWVVPDFVYTPGPTLRSCVNCGRVQRLVPEQWIDDTDQE
jgi:hypothetical protein